MFNTYLLFAITLCCTIIGTQCNTTDASSCVIQGSVAFEMIMSKLNRLETMCGCKQTVLRYCSDAPSSGVYNIQPGRPFNEPIRVLCDKDFENGGWIVIQHRFDGSTNFYRSWQEYKYGFGNLEGEFWMGLDRIHQLTTSGPYELVIVLEDFDGNKKFAKYDQFEIGNESQTYVITKVAGYSGTTGDSFSEKLGMKFSTFDSDNDTWAYQCAVRYSGAWWYGSCHSSNLNGKYLRGETTEYATGMVWRTFRGYYYSLKISKMMIRPKVV